MKNRLLLSALALLTLLTPLYAQDQQESAGFLQWVNIVETPFLFFCLFGGIQVFNAFKQGIFSRGMRQLFMGLVVLAIGHILLFLDSVMILDLHGNVGQVILLVIFSIGWLLSGVGFSRLFRDSRVAD